MPTINGHPYHLTTSAMESFHSEPSTIHAITTPPTPPIPSLPPPTEERWTLSALGEWTPPSAPSTMRSRPDVRHAPRIPRLRRPVTLERSHPQIRNPHNPQHMSISSAISSATPAHFIRSSELAQSDQCLDSTDITALFTPLQDHSLLTMQKFDNCNYLNFRLMHQKSSISRSLFDVEKYTSYQNGAIYRVFNSQNTLDMPLEYADRGPSCTIFQLILMTPQTGYSPPCRDGMVLISHRPFDRKDTRRFDHFTKQDFEEYQESSDGTHGDDRLAAWFQIVDDQPMVVDLGERSGRYILIKLFPSEHDSASLELYYIGLVGYSGARSFAKGELC